MSWHCRRVRACCPAALSVHSPVDLALKSGEAESPSAIISSEYFFLVSALEPVQSEKSKTAAALMQYFVAPVRPRPALWALSAPKPPTASGLSFKPATIPVQGMYPTRGVNHCKRLTLFQPPAPGVLSTPIHSLYGYLVLLISYSRLFVPHALDLVEILKDHHNCVSRFRIVLVLGYHDPGDRTGPSFPRTLSSPQIIVEKKTGDGDTEWSQ
ncbi:hypothetical protein V8F20_003696 [Naviculisporaceae sp. PSN 640]